MITIHATTIVAGPGRKSLPKRGDQVSNRWLVLCLLSCLFPLALISLPLRAGQQIYRIMAVGDSITEGGRNFSSYRFPLWEKLFAAGYLVEFVGSRTSETRIGPLPHEGYSGKNAEYLAGILGDKFRAHPADIVLIHAGHNHTNDEAPVPGIAAATEAMIQTVRGINPRVTVLIAKVIPSGKLPKYAYLPTLNLELAKLAARLDTPGQPVRAVDMAAGFDWHTDTIEDHVHPNQIGAGKIADHWFAALTNVLAAPAQSFHPRLATYGRFGDPELALHIFSPKDSAASTLHPAVVFFFGGGWTVGTPVQFYSECAHFAERGLVAISADYRIAALQHTTPFESVADGKAAIRWVRRHAAELRVNPNRIVAAGASAGGQIAAATALVPGLENPGEDLSISSKPDALLLWYAVVDNGPGGYGYNQFKDRYRQISPLHNISNPVPPTLFLLGGRDPYVPASTAQAFKSKMEAVGGRCDLKIFPEAGHPIYEYRQGDSPYREQTLAAADDFLESLGYFRQP